MYDPRAFKLDHLESLKPIFLKYIYTLLTNQMQIPFLHAFGPCPTEQGAAAIL